MAATGRQLTSRLQISTSSLSMAKWCHLSYSSGPDCALPDLGIFPRHIPTAAPTFLGLSHGARGDTRLGCNRLNHWPWHSSLGFARFQQRLFGGDAGISQHSWRAFLSCWVTPSKKEKGGGGYFLHNKVFWVCFSYYYRYGIRRKFKNRKQTTYSAAMLTPLCCSRHRMNLKNVSP